MTLKVSKAVAATLESLKVQTGKLKTLMALTTLWIEKRTVMSWETLQASTIKTIKSRDAVTLGSCSCSCLSPGKIRPFSARRIL